LDALASLAEAATMAPVPYIRPIMCDRGKGNIILEGVHYPCLELQENITFIANDVSLLRGDRVGQEFF
jgi:DNA mismatch repair ATPase MutS